MQWWSWSLMMVGVSGLYLVGRGGWLTIAGWSVGVAAQFLWLAYAIVTKQYGFIVSALAYGTISAVNLRKALVRQRADDVGK